MKRATHIAILVLLAGTITSCEKIKSWFDVEGDSTLSTNLDIVVSEPAMKSTASIPFHDEAPIDPLSDYDIAEYQENIKKIEATNIVATVTGVSGKKEGADVIFYKGTYFAVKGSKEAKWILDEDWNVTVGDEITLKDDVGAVNYSKITEMLTNLEAVTVIADGTCNQSGVFVSLEVGIDIKYTANPL